MGIWFCIIILSISIIILVVKIYLMKKDIKDINNSFSEIIKSDTNNLLTISSNNKEIKMLAEMLNQELKKLREKRLEYENGNQELKSSITDISHDIRTPLTAISGYIDLLNETTDEKKQREYIEIIQRKTKDLNILTEQLFDFSKAIDIGENLKKEKCSINELLEEAIANYYMIFKEYDISPMINICNKKIYKNVNRNTMIRVFENILSNVSKYSNGDVKIELRGSGKVIFSNKASSLDAMTVKKIFNRYYTVDNIKKSTGIGLSIAKQLVELNGGRIEARYEAEYLIIEIIL